MAKRRNGAQTAKNTGATVGYEAELWRMADAMAGIERDNPALKGVLPKDYARPALDKRRLGQLIDLVSNIDLRPSQPSPGPSAHPLPVGEGLGEGVAVYRDIPGFCKSATLDEIRKHGHVLTPGRYVGAEAPEDDGEPFKEKMQRLAAQLCEQQAEAATLDAAVAQNLKELGYGL